MPTWWCGGADGLGHVLEHAGRLSIRAIDGSGGPIRGSVEELRRRVLGAPHRYVGQERPALSQAPSWLPAGATPRTVTLRTFTLRYGSSYRPLVGGLANVYAGGRSVSTKDVWVLKSEASLPDQGLADVLPMTSVRSATSMVPRTLEDMYWFGRYAERAEDTLRLLLATHVLSEDFRTQPRSTGGAGLAVLLDGLDRLTPRRHEDLDGEFRSLLLDAERPGSVAQSLESMREALAGVREQMSNDAWRVFGVTDRAAAALRETERSHQVAESAGRTLTGVLSLQGVTASMIRDEGWHMFGLGHAVERALQLVMLLRATTVVRRGLDVDREVLNAVLAASESAVTHRRRYRGYVRIRTVLDLLVTDTENPRSLAFSLREAREHLTRQSASTGSSRPERLIDDLVAGVESVDVATLVAIGGVGRPNLESFLDATLGQLVRLADAIAELHFATGPAPRAFGTIAIVDSLTGLAGTLEPPLGSA